MSSASGNSEESGGGTAVPDTVAPNNVMVIFNSPLTTTFSPDLSLRIRANENDYYDSGITGYYLTDSAGPQPAAPSSGSGGWTTVSATSFYNQTINYTLSGSYSGGDEVTIYLWFKDKTGNVSTVATASITVLAPTAPPANVQVVPRNMQNIISWDEVAGAVSYNIYYGESAGVTSENGQPLINAVSPYNHLPLSNTTRYYYVVYAANDFGESAISVERSAGPGFELDAPVISDLNPSVNAVAVSLDSNISFSLSDGNGWGVNPDTLNVTIGGSSVISNGVFLSGFSGSVVSDNLGGYEVTINPHAGFAYSENVSVMIAVYDYAGNSTGGLVYSFTCVDDETPPYLTNMSPAANAVDVAINTNIAFLIRDDETSVDVNSIDVTIEGVDVIINGQFQSGCSGSFNSVTGGYNVTINPAASFLYDQAVNVTIDAADLGIVPNAMNQVSYSFTTLSEGWQVTDSMNYARDGHTATRLNDGRVLVAGGDIDGYPGDSCELYNSDNDTWTATGSLNQSRKGHTATLLADGRVLVAGGYSNGYILGVCELYDPANSSWSVADSLSQERKNHTATLLADGRVLVVGGADQFFYFGLKTCEIYDPVNNIWSATGSMNNNRCYQSATLLTDGRVLVVGGYSYSYGELKSCELYDPGTGTWNLISQLHTNSAYLAALIPLNNGQVLVAGGNGQSCEVYDAQNETWSYTDSLNQYRVFSSITKLFDGRVLVAGGHDGSDETSSCELYNYNIPLDDSGPSVSGQAPGDGESGVANDTDIFLVINDPLSASDSFYGVDRNSINITVAGAAAVVDGIFQAGFDIASVIVPNEIDGCFVTINASDFSPGETVTVTVDAADLAPDANAMPTLSYSFTCN